jgi:hypothetical protein
LANFICILFGTKESLELVSEYKYLGIIFKPSGSFSFAKNYLSKKASKAMFCIRKTLYSEKLNAFLVGCLCEKSILYQVTITLIVFGSFLLLNKY